MPKKKVQETQAEQSKRFRKTVRDLEAAGELNPIVADKALDGIVRKAATESNSAHNAKGRKT